MNKAQEFDRFAETVFSAAYPLLAQQIVSKLGMSGGVCLDVGCGGGQLGFALLDRVAELSLVCVDINPDAVDIALSRAEKNGLSCKVRGLVCPVEKIPLEEGTVDYIVSRGSLWRWKDHDAAFKELLRLLTPGGFMFIGGGFGSGDIFQLVNTRMEEIRPGWIDNVRKKLNDVESLSRFAKKLAAFGVKTTVIDDDSGRWIIGKKTAYMDLL